MTGICVENCKLLLMKSVGNGRYKDEEVDFYKGKMADIGDQVTNIGGNDFVELAVQDHCCDWDNKYYMIKYYMIKKSDRDKFFKRMAEEVVQCKSFELPDEMNEFLRTINPDKVVSCGCSHTDNAPCYWVYYKTFVEKGWEE